MKRKVSFLLVLALVASLVTIPSLDTVYADVAAPEPDQISIKFDDNGNAYNSISSAYTIAKTDANVTPEVITDPDTGMKYLFVDSTIDNDFYRIDEQSGAQTTFFWNNFWNIQSSKTNDLSFTWEVYFMIPEFKVSNMWLMGYTSSGNGGFGLRYNGNGSASFAIGNQLNGAASQGGGKEMLTVSFPMEEGEWYHCIMTYDHTNKVMAGYVNGSLAGSVAVSDVILYSYNWNANQIYLAATNAERMASGQKSLMDEYIGVFNFSHYSVSADQAAAIYEKNAKKWAGPVKPEKAPAPNQICIKIDENGNAYNSISGSPYTIAKTDANVTPEIGTVAGTASKYIIVDSTVDNDFYRINEQGSPQTTFFWKNYYNIASGKTNDLSFTWEVYMMVPEFKTSGTYLMGYTSSGKGGFGLQYDGNNSACFLIGNQLNGAAGTGGGKEWIKVNFTMEAGEWYHLIMTYDHAQKKMTGYVNGAEVGSASVSDVILYAYDWNGNQLYMAGTNNERISSGKSAFDEYIGIFNYSDYSVTAGQALGIYQEAMAAWNAPLAETGIDYAQPVLTDTIAMEYGATVLENAESVQMKFTFLGNETVVDGIEGEENNYTFALPEILPQQMGANIKSELIVDGEVVQTKDEYSVKEYCMNQLETAEGALRTLFITMLNYGAAAQVYFDGAEGGLVNEDITDVFSSFDISEAEGVIATPLSGTVNDSYKFKSAALGLFDQVSVRFKFAASDLSNLTVEIGDKVYTAEDFTSAGTGLYCVEYADVLACEYAKPISAVIKLNGVQIGQMATYSVNTYLKNKSESASVGEIVQAVYDYGYAAAAYVSAQAE